MNESWSRVIQTIMLNYSDLNGCTWPDGTLDHCINAMKVVEPVFGMKIALDTLAKILDERKVPQRRTCQPLWKYTSSNRLACDA